MRAGTRETSATPGTIRWSSTRGFRVWFPLALYAVTRTIDAIYFAVMQTHQIAMGGSVEVARSRAYAAVDRLSWPGMHVRRDIAGDMGSS